MSERRFPSLTMTQHYRHSTHRTIAGLMTASTLHSSPGADVHEGGRRGVGPMLTKMDKGEGGQF